MAIFGKKKKKEQGCCTNISPESIARAQLEQNEGADVKILGSGCKKCNELEANTKAALKELGMNTTVEHITDFSVIAAYGVMTTPALVMGGKVVSTGKVLKQSEVVELIKKYQ